MTGFIIANSKLSPEFFVWGAQKSSKNDDRRNRTRMESEPECSITSTPTRSATLSQTDASLSSAIVSTTHTTSSTLRPSNESSPTSITGPGSSTSSSALSQMYSSQNSVRGAEQSWMELSDAQHASFFAVDTACSKHSQIMEEKTTRRVPYTNSLGELIFLTDHQISKRSQKLRKGKETLGYINYLKVIPKRKRLIGKHQWTPDPKRRISQRRFEGKVRSWRRFLHQWDDASTLCTTSESKSKIKTVDSLSSKMTDMFVNKADPLSEDELVRSRNH